MLITEGTRKRQMAHTEAISGSVPPPTGPTQKGSPLPGKSSVSSPPAEMTRDGIG